MPQSKTWRESPLGGGPLGQLHGIYGRAAELDQLRHRLRSRRPFLFHGPAGVGKSLLLSVVVPESPRILYSGQNPTSQVMYRNLAESLLAACHPVFANSCTGGSPSLHAKSTLSLKGLLRDALLNSEYLVVLDHLVRPSQPLAAAVRELMLNWSVAVVAVTRSAHMEDAGFVLSLFADRREKLALRNFDPDTGRQFAEECAKQEGLAADNLAQFLGRVVECSDGNPGAILRLVRMAKDPRYSNQRRIKTTPLCIDYKISMVSQ